jgi:hypothetical protein
MRASAGTLTEPSMEWWLTSGAQPPIGPIATELLVKGIRAGKVPNDTLVCEVGGATWKRIGDVGVLAAAFVERTSRCSFDEWAERTITDYRPMLPSEPPYAALHAFDDPEEKTVVDVAPLRPSEPP